MCNLNLFECTQSWRRCWWLSGVSISYAGVLNSIGLGPFHQIFRGLGGKKRKKGECASKYKRTELHLSFSCVWSRGRGAGLNTEFLLSRFLCVSGRGGRSMNQTCHETFHVHPHTPPTPPLFFLLIYSDELINPSLSCHKVPLSVWTYGTKASDAKRWNRGISLQLNCACLFLLTLHQPRLPCLCLPVCLVLRCDVSVVFSQTQPVTLWAAGCRCRRRRRLHTDGISLPHPPSYIKFATGPL